MPRGNSLEAPGPTGKQQDEPQNKNQYDKRTEELRNPDHNDAERCMLDAPQAHEPLRKP